VLRSRWCAETGVVAMPVVGISTATPPHATAIAATMVAPTLRRALRRASGLCSLDPSPMPRVCVLGIRIHGYRPRGRVAL